MYYYGEECGRVPAAQTHIQDCTQKVTVQGQAIEVTVPLRVHTSTGEIVADESLDGVLLTSAFEVYRRRFNIPTPEQIAEWRKQYGLSQKNLALLLGFGSITIHRYESGEVPDAAHADVLRLLQNPVEVRRLLEANGHRLTETVRTRLENRLNDAAYAERPEQIRKLVEATARHREPDIFTGYRRFQPQLLEEMIVFFSQQLGGVFKTKLNKLLWYSDFLHFARHGVSLSGTAYVAMQYGPVPDSYELLFTSLNEEGEIAMEEVALPGGNTGFRVLARRTAHTGLLGEEATDLLNEVAGHFSGTTSGEISELSHLEVGWSETVQGGDISYRYAADLKAIPTTLSPLQQAA